MKKILLTIIFIVTAGLTYASNMGYIIIIYNNTGANINYTYAGEYDFGSYSNFITVRTLQEGEYMVLDGYDGGGEDGHSVCFNLNSATAHKSYGLDSIYNLDVYQQSNQAYASFLGELRVPGEGFLNATSGNIEGITDSMTSTAFSGVTIAQPSTTPSVVEGMIELDKDPNDSNNFIANWSNSPESYIPTPITAYSGVF